MAVAVVQSANIESSGAVASLSKAFTSNIGSGSPAVVVGALSDGNKATGAGIFSDNNSGSYTRIVQTGDVALGRALAHAAGATTVTYTPDSGTDYCGLGIMEVSGLHATPDDGSTTRSATDTTPRTNAITTTANGIVFGGFARHSAGLATDVAGNHTADIFQKSGYTSVNGALGYRVPATAGSQELQWDLSSSLAYKGAIMALKEPAGSQSVVPVLMAQYRQRRA
jgi:hypothetical protein